MSRYIFTCENCYTKNDKSMSVIQMITRLKKNNDKEGVLMGVCIGCEEQLLILVDSNYNAELISLDEDASQYQLLDDQDEKLIEFDSSKTETEAENNIDIGQKAFMEENYEKAYNYWKKACNWYEQHLPQSELVTILLNNLGMARSRLKQPQKALEYFLKVLPLVDKKNTAIFATVLNNIGAAYLHLGDFDNAEEYHYRAFEEHLKNTTDEQLLQREKNNIIFVYIKRIHQFIVEEKYFDAIVYEDKCIDIYKKINEEAPSNFHTLRKGNHFYNLGDQEFQKGNLEIARDYLLKALEFHKMAKAHNMIKIYDLNTLSDIYRQMGEYKENLSVMKEIDTLAKQSDSELPRIVGELRKKSKIRLFIENLFNLLKGNRK